ncbi:PQQ-dependent sugar dehydrogenase [Microvirga terricola]|uniref:Sorbosone dehydrogenase n=1 Tax=Microvirga terricola TaxID=2719797 RepID=A0ABX0V8N8_9HYPH|nr:PQQ-dependent sugar dehydrogenase [Microvirga terricola]NIX76208.1 sorbosone dehydrogenase [Microvirga terricola]
MKPIRLAVAAVFLLASPALAQPVAQSPTGNLEKLSPGTGTVAPRPIPQGGRRAEVIRKHLENIRLPPGFKIGLYAIVPDARHMAVGPSIGIVFVGTRKGHVYAVADRDKDRIADEVTAFAPPIQFRVPNGVCFSRDGVLFVVEQNRVLEFPAAESLFERPDIAAFVVTKQGELIPPSEESYNHTARVCRIGPDNKLYIALGQPYNVPPRDKIALYNKVGVGGIIRIDQDGKSREVYATGIRNSVGMDFNPADKTLWFTDNQVDGMGDDRPPEELNRAPQIGQNFGFPYYGGDRVRTNEYKNDPLPAGLVPPQVEMAAHAANLGMTFYTGTMFPQFYRGGIFTAQHGSWNRTKPIGARVMFTSLKPDGTADQSEVFAEGWLTENGEYLGRPVDVAMLPDGSLLVSDDTAGAIYRISYEGQ